MYPMLSRACNEHTARQLRLELSIMAIQYETNVPFPIHKFVSQPQFNPLVLRL